MKKRILITAIIFMVCAGMLKYMDIITNYEIGLWDYLHFSRKLNTEDRSFLNSKEINYGIAVNDEPFAYVCAQAPRGNWSLQLLPPGV